MKKHLFFKSLLVLVGVLITSLTTQVGAATWYQQNNSSHVYFNDYPTGWVSDPSSATVVFLMGRDNNYGGQGSGSQAYRMSHIAHTKIWYKNVPSWGTGDGAWYEYIAFRYASGTTGWDNWESTWVTNRAKYSNTKYAMTWNYDITGKTRLFTPQGSSTNTDMNVATELTKYTAYLRVKYDENRTGTYGTVITGETTWSHGVTFDFTGTYMTSASASAQSKISGLTKNCWTDGSTKWGYEQIPVTGEVRFELKGIDTGFELAGWAYSEDATSPAYETNPEDVTFQVLGNTSYVAFIRRKQYTVTLNDNGGSGGSGSKTVKYDLSTNMTTSVTTPSKTGYSFQGYWTNSNGTGSQIIDKNGAWVKSVAGYTGTDGSSNPKWVRDGGVTLYAKWTQDISLDREGGTTGSTSLAAVYNATLNLGSYTAPGKTGYSFAGYWTGDDGTGNMVINTSSVVQTVSNWTNSDKKWIHAEASTLHAKWTAKNYTINLENNGADEGHKGTLNTTVTYNAKTGMGDITKPEKTHYDFGGYYTGDGGTGTQIIDADGHWLSSKSGYTDESGNWICTTEDLDDGDDDGYDVKLYAKWTETPYTITMAVSPSGAGTTSPASTATGKLVTESGNITATPAAGWVFKEWQFSKTDENYDVWCADGYSSTNATIHIKAQHNGTLTAVFEPRYYLVGGEYKNEGGVESENITSSGMPGWANYEAPFTVISTSPFEATCTRTLTANKTYRLMVLDKSDGYSYGKTAAVGIEELEDGESIELVDKDNKVQFYSNGGTTYVFTITDSDSDGSPTISLDRPKQVNFGWKYQDIDGTLRSGDTGGSVAVTKTSGGASITSGDWVPYNTSVTHTPTATSPGYTFAGWWVSNAFEGDNFSTTTPLVYSVTETDNAYAKFTETSTAVTLANDGHGKVQIGEEDATNTTCGVTTTRSITAVPNDGYSFSSWTTSSTPDFGVASTTTAATTLTGHGAGTAGTLTANFSANSYTVTLNDDHGGSNNGTATAVYDATALSSITNATFSDWTLLGYWNTDGNQVTDASGNLQSSVTNYTSSTGEWKYVGNVTLYAHWTRSVTLDREDGTTGSESVTVTYKGSTLSGFTAPTKTGYNFAGYWTGDDGTGTEVINTSGALQANVSGYTNSDSQWTKADATTLYAKWTPKTYTAANNIDANGGSSAGQYTATYGANTITINTEPVKAGYEVEGYYRYQEGNNKVADAEGNLVSGLDGVISGGNWIYDGDDLTIYPQWQPKSYTITLNANLGGISGTSGSTSFKVTSGTNSYDFDPSTAGNQSCTIPTKEGYTFAGYYAAVDGDTQVFGNNGAIVGGVSGYTDGSSNWVNTTEPLTLYAHWTDNGTYYFKGGASGNETSWNTAANWTKGQAPDDATDNVYILAPVVVPASATTTVNSVRIGTAGSYTPTGSATSITADGKLTIPATAMLKVTTDVQNYNFSTSTPSATTPATLHIQSASSGNGALVWGTSGTPGEAQVDFYTKSSAAGTGTGSTSDVNQYIGTPFSDESNYYNYYNAWVFEVDYSSLSWKRLPMGTGMSPFVGYDVIYDGDAGHVFEMDGTLVTNANRSVSALNATESVLANSWVAPIKIKAFEASDFSGPNATIYIFNSTSEKATEDNKYSTAATGGNYSTYTPGTAEETDVIPSMQSFSVIGGTGTVALDYAKLVKNPTGLTNGPMHAPRRVNSDEPEEEFEPKMESLKIHVSDENGWADLLKIYIREDFVYEFENGFDARKMYGDEHAPMLYGISTDGMMAIHCIPTADNQVVGFHAGTASNEYTFRFTYDGEDDLYLRDTKLGIETKIDAEHNYRFFATPDDSDMRFVIVKKIQGAATGVDNYGSMNGEDGAQKILFNNKMYIIRGGKIYSATGALVK